MIDFLDFAIFFVVYCIVLLMVLPIGATPSATPEEGHAASAPDNPKLKKKLLITLIIALPVTWGVGLLFD